MGRVLETAHEAALSKLRRRTTLQITLGDGTPLNLSTADFSFGGLSFLGKLAPPSDELNLDATQAQEGINLQITNATLSLGQNLINTPDILSGTSAILGAYFYDQDTGSAWHDVKLQGTIQVGDIDNDWVNIFFESTVSGATWKGVTIASLFPDDEIPAAEIPQTVTAPIPAYNDIQNVPGNEFESTLSPLTGSLQDGGRYFLPEFNNY